MKYSITPVNKRFGDQMKNFKEIFRSIIRKNIDISRERISILIELASFDKGGLEKVVLDSAIELDKNKYEVTIITPGKLGHLGEIARSNGLTVIKLPEIGKKTALKNIIKRNNIKLAISHFSDFGYPIYKEMNVKNITFIHNVYAFFSESQAESFKKYDKYIDKYISVSPNATTYAVKKLNIDLSKVITIPNGLIIKEHEQREIEPFNLTRSDLGLKDDDYVFVNVASYNLHKGHYLMVDAMRALVPDYPDIKILCVGNEIYPPHVRDLRNLILKNGLENHILMPGYFEDIASIFNISDAFLLPSFIEGWSIAMNEAMFYRLPMILTDTGASSEVIKDNDIGILIPNEYGSTENLNASLLNELTYSPRSYQITENLKSAMVDMYENNVLWREKAFYARRKIYQDYDFSRIIRQHENVFSDIIVGNKN